MPRYPGSAASVSLTPPNLIGGCLTQVSCLALQVYGVCKINAAWVERRAAELPGSCDDFRFSCRPHIHSRKFTPSAVEPGSGPDLLVCVRVWPGALPWPTVCFDLLELP